MSKLSPEILEVRNENKKLDCETLKAVIPENLLKFSKIVGNYFWIEFLEKPDDETRETLCILGFFWNKKRGAWMHAGGTAKRRFNTKIDPREKYEVKKLTF